MYGVIYRNLLFPAYESWLCRRRTLRDLRELMGTQWLPTDEVKRRQWGPSFRRASRRKLWSKGAES